MSLLFSREMLFTVARAIIVTFRLAESTLKFIGILL